MNKTRVIILSSLAIPLLMGMAWWLLYKYYDPEKPAGDLSILTEHCQIRAVDAARLACRWTRPENLKDIQRKLLLVSSLYRDGDWNSRGLSPRSGARLARQLARQGIATLRFDHRGTGDSSASQKSLRDLDLIQADINEALRLLAYGSNSQPAPVAPLYVLAHADACALTMDQLQSQRPEQNLRVAGVVLISCGTPGDYLEEWGRLTFRNMERQGVRPEILSQARQEWQAFRKDGRIAGQADTPPRDAPEPASQPEPHEHPDILAFRKALRWLSSNPQKAFREPASKIELQKSVELFHRQGGRVLHVLARYEDEWSQSDLDAISNFGQRMDQQANYQFQIISDTDYLLRRQRQPVQHLLANLGHNLSPWRPLSEQAVNSITSFLLSTNSSDN